VRMKIIVIGAGPVGSLAAIYAAQRGHEVEVYELRNGKGPIHFFVTRINSVHVNIFDISGSCVSLRCPGNLLIYLLGL
jgi:2-polyprenyl-6-methoxyphenol hydroxylase-like FAD-dependent oxidoreductase